MVKAQKIIGRKALTFGAILSIGFFGGIAKAETPPNTFGQDFGGEDLVYARQRAVTNAKDNTAAVVRAEEIKKELEQNPGNAAAARDLQQTNRGIDQRSQQTYGDADRFQGDREMQQLATNVANTAKDWPHVQAYADRWAALAKPDSPEWAKAVNTGGLAAHEAGDHKKATASALRVLEKFPKDKDALFLYHASKGRGTAVTAPTPNAAQGRPAPPTAVPSPYRDPQVQLAGERALGRQQAIGFYNRARSSNDLGDTARALEYAQAAIRADPSLPDSYMERAKALLGTKGGDRRDQLAQAINDLRSAMELWMKNGQTGRLAEANGLSAKAKNANGDHRGAQDDADKAVSYDAGYAPAYWERGAAREALKQKELALADYNKSAELLPQVYGGPRDEATARLMAPENAGPVPVARPAESPLRKTWTKFLTMAGGGLTLVVLLALWTRRRSSVVGAHTPAQDGPSLTPMRGQDDADGLEGRTVDGGKYRVVCMLGQGGMGTVYKAYDLGLKRDVAIKRMNDFLLPDHKARERFVAEGRTGAKLRHPNIVAVYSFFMEGERALIVFEHIEGNTLHDMLNESPGRRLDFSLALKILAQLASAVDCAHGEGVIHRDLKPSNVMVYGGDKAKVMDFGISRVVQHVQATKTDTIVGTPVYMAPEQQDGVVVRESDIYTLGIMAFEMLTGMLPFRGEGQQLDKREGRFPAASALMPSLPAAVDVVFKKVLDPDFKKRYTCAEDFRQALEVALSQATPPRA
jgi:tetratricopeptide (TPR) repeat protein